MKASLTWGENICDSKSCSSAAERCVTSPVHPLLLFPASWIPLVYVPARFLFRGVIGTYLRCTADPANLQRRSTRRGLGDRTHTTCIPLVHYTFLYKFCQTCVAHKLWGEKKMIQSQIFNPLKCMGLLLRVSPRLVNMANNPFSAVVGTALQ